MIRTLAIRTLMPLSWRASSRHAARCLAEFAEVEADSGWQFLRAAERAQDVRHRALLFRHAIEEADHSEAFHRLAEKTFDGHLPRPDRKRLALVDDLGMAPFLAYSSVGEELIAHDFLAYEGAANTEAATATFRMAGADERGHENGLRDMLKELVGPTRAKALVSRARWRFRYEGWMRASRGIGAFVFGVYLFVTYLVLSALFGGSAGRRMRRRTGPLPRWEMPRLAAARAVRP